MRIKAKEVKTRREEERKMRRNRKEEEGRKGRWKCEMVENSGLKPGESRASTTTQPLGIPLDHHYKVTYSYIHHSVITI